MVQKVKEKKGFTLAELLVVVAIIGVLVAVSIPIFTSQLRKATLATNQANARAAYAAVVAELLDSSETNGTYTYTVATAKAKKEGTKGSVKDNPSKWGVDTEINGKKMGDARAVSWTINIASDGEVTYGCSFDS